MGVSQGQPTRIRLSASKYLWRLIFHVNYFIFEFSSGAGKQGKEKDHLNVIILLHVEAK